MSYFAAERQYKGTANKEIITQPQPPTRLGEKYDAGSGPSILAKGPDEKVACMLKIAHVGADVLSSFEKEANIFSRGLEGLRNFGRSIGSRVSQLASPAPVSATASPQQQPAPNPAPQGQPAQGAPTATANPLGLPPMDMTPAAFSGFKRDPETGLIYPLGSQSQLQGGAPDELTDMNPVRYLMLRDLQSRMGQRDMMEYIEQGLPKDAPKFTGMDKFKARMSDLIRNPYFSTLAPMFLYQVPVGSYDDIDEYGRRVKRTKTLGDTDAGRMLLPLGMLAAAGYGGPLNVNAQGLIEGPKGPMPAAAPAPQA